MEDAKREEFTGTGWIRICRGAESDVGASLSGHECRELLALVRALESKTIAAATRARLDAREGE